MPQIKRDELTRMVSQIEIKSKTDWIQHLQNLGFPIARIANYGCATGVETLALISVLHPTKAVGIDRNINEARLIISELHEDIDETKMALPYASQEDIVWWTKSVPNFIKDQHLPSFIQENDVANPEKPHQLPENYFDLACCSNFLYQILEYQGNEDVINALKEMVRVVKVGGWIVVTEPNDGKPGRFQHYFEELTLEFVEISTNEFNAIYVFKKTSE